MAARSGGGLRFSVLRKPSAVAPVVRRAGTGRPPAADLGQCPDSASRLTQINRQPAAEISRYTLQVATAARSSNNVFVDDGI